MSKCPYTWFKSLFGRAPKADGPPENLFVRVVREDEEKVFVALPARSARWLIELIPDDVMTKIRGEKIPIDEILDDLKTTPELVRQSIFTLEEPGRTVQVWLE